MVYTFASLLKYDYRSNKRNLHFPLRRIFISSGQINAVSKIPFRLEATWNTSKASISKIEKEKEAITASTLGYRASNFYIPALFFADDGLLLANSMKQAEQLFCLMRGEAEECGLTINRYPEK